MVGATRTIAVLGVIGPAFSILYGSMVGATSGVYADEDPPVTFQYPLRRVDESDDWLRFGVTSP